MLRRDLGELTELLTVTLWESLAAVRAFAGDDYEYHPVVDTLASAKAQRMNRAAQPPVPSDASRCATRRLTPPGTGMTASYRGR
jgi:hypothetical protein